MLIPHKAGARPNGGGCDGTAAKLPPLKVIVGSTPRMAVIFEHIKKLASAHIPVLLTGESGTGKELIATLIHCYSPIPSRPLVQINCAALPATMIESELFGYEAGAFTGASVSKCGRVELAGTGTLFLDEITELDLSLQAKLLQLLQDGQFTALGGREERHVDSRFIFATNRDLQQEIRAGNFRADLFYRMDGVTLHLPPLRERVEDVPVLVEYFLEKYNGIYNCRAESPSNSTIEQLQAYHWPGNIRQLENVIRRYVVLGSQETMIADLTNVETDVFQFAIPQNGKISLKEITRRAVRQVERQVIFKVMEANGWKRKKSARTLNISYRALLYKLTDMGIPPQQ
jgi:two-component system response regulator AtoC